MAEYQLYCFAQSGNSYKAALMLALIGARWTPIHVDFFRGETRSAQYRESVNEMGEVPVLVEGSRKLSQSGAILEHLAQQSGKFGSDDDDDRLEILRWILFDNQRRRAGLGSLPANISLALVPKSPSYWLKI